MAYSVNKTDHSLRPRERAFFFDVITYGVNIKKGNNKHYCMNCSTLHDWSIKEHKPCPKCGKQVDYYLLGTNKNYYTSFYYEVYRPIGKNSVVSLLFLISTTIKDGMPSHSYTLVRKKYYNNKGIYTLARKGLRPGGMLGYWSFNPQKGKEFVHIKNKYVLSNQTPAYAYRYNTFVLKRLSYLKGISYPVVSDRQILKAWKYPFTVYCLQKYFNLSDDFISLRTIKAHYKTLMKYRHHFNNYKYINVDVLRYLTKRKDMITVRDFKILYGYRLEYPNGIKKIDGNYDRLIKIGNPNGFDTYYYRDYKNMAVNNGHELNESVLYNPKWKQLHDKWARERRIEEAKEKSIKLSKVMKSYDDLVIDGYYIKVPRSYEDLVIENDTLRHCVAGYIDRIINKETFVCFVRKIPTEPFLTAEISEGEVLQLRGKDNLTTDVDDIHYNILHKYIKEVNLNDC